MYFDTIRNCSNSNSCHIPFSALPNHFQPFTQALFFYRALMDTLENNLGLGSCPRILHIQTGRAWDRTTNLAISSSTSWATATPYSYCTILSPGAWHPNRYGLCSSSTPLWGLSSSQPAIWSLEICVGNQGDQYRRIPSSKASSISTWLHPQWHPGQSTAFVL